jgi:hypothetical protein
MGGVIGLGMIEDQRSGYSNVVEFSDPLTAKSSHLQGTGLRVGRIAGQEITPVAVARNVGTTDTILTGRIPYALRDGNTGSVPLRDVRLAAGEVRAINLASALKENGIGENVATAGLEFEYSTPPGSVVVSAESVSSRNVVFRMLMMHTSRTRPIILKNTH